MGGGRFWRAEHVKYMGTSSRGYGQPTRARYVVGGGTVERVALNGGGWLYRCDCREARRNGTDTGCTHARAVADFVERYGVRGDRR